MIIQLKKGRDGPSTLACVRADGSRTWARVHPFLPDHDLTHCAVESVLGFKQAFFGLVASGWQIDDFSFPDTRTRVPVEAHWAESIVGILDLERGSARHLAEPEFAEALASSLRAQGLPPYRSLRSSQLDAIRALRADLFERWCATAPGGTLEMPFPAVHSSPA